MPYIGYNVTNAGSFALVDDIASTFNGSNTAFTLQVGGVNITPNVQNLLIAIDGVVQQAPDAYSVSGSTITFTGAPASGADFYGVLMGQSSYVENNSITADELAVSGDGTSGQLLSTDGDGTFSYINQSAVTADANVLSGTTLKSTVVNSSLTSVGTLTSLTTSGTISSSTSSTTDSALTLTDAGVADYKFTFPDTSTIRLSTSTSSTKVFDLSNAGSGKMKLSVDGGLRPITGSDYSLVLESTNELNFYNADGYADSNRATLHINYSGTGSSVDLANSELVVTKGTGSTFAGDVNVTADGARLFVKSSTNELVSIGRAGSSGDALNQGYIRMKNHSGTNTIALHTAGDSYFNGGNVGVHTTSPSVGGWSSERGVLTISSTDNAGANNYSILEMQGHSFNSSGINGLIMFLDHTVELARIQSNSLGSNQGDIRFSTNNGSANGERLRIKSSGVIVSQQGIEFQGTALGTGQTGVASSGSGGDLRFYANGTQQVTLKTSGVLGIENGDSSGTGATKGIHIDTTGVPFLRYQETNSSGGTADYEIYVANGVYVLYDNDDSAGVYSVSTSQVISGDFNDTSDIGLKENIKTIDSGLSIINKLNPVTFDWKNKKKGSNSGFIAQEVEKLLPNDVEGEDFNTDYPSGRVGDVIEDEDKGFNNFGKSINTSGIVAHLTKAVQELSSQNNELRARIEALEA